MVQKDGAYAETEGQELKEEIRTVFERTTDQAMSTHSVAEAVGVDEATARKHLDRLSEEGEITRVDLEGEYVGWERPDETFVARSGSGAYTITDPRSGLVTRADSRSRALRQLADRIEQFEDGNHVGAQILGICESAISPGYLTTVEDVLDTYVRPDNVHLYVYVEDEGITEIQTPAQLSRDQQILGFTVTGRFDRDEFSEAMVVSADSVIERSPVTAADFPVSVFKVVAVHPDHHHEGIGTALATHGLAYLAETPPVLALLWGKDDDSNTGLAEKVDFDELAEFDNATPLDRQCPVCGFDNRCSCSSILYGWGIETATD